MLPPTVEAAIALARQNNPSLLVAIHNKDAAKAAIGVAKSASKPVISLNGTLGGQRNQISGLSSADQAALTAQITVPFYSGGANKSKIRQARHANMRIGYEIKDTERAIDAGVRQLWAQLDAARQAVKSSHLQVQAAEVAFEGVELEQSVGTRTTLDVLDAEQEVLNAKLSLISAERSFDEATFQLLAILGVFDAKGMRLPVGLYDPGENFEAIKDDLYSRVTRTVFPDDVVSTLVEIPKKLASSVIKNGN